MKKITLSLIITPFFLQCGHSQAIQNLNLDFEQTEKNFPSTWETFGNNTYKIYSDSDHVKSGKFSAVIENNGDQSEFAVLSFTLPDNYDGKTIRLKGFIKTENVTGGYAGLWMRIDPQLGSSNMNNRGVTGTTEWKEYDISLQLHPHETEKIVIGGVLVGKGKMWLDDFHVIIDGNDLGSKKIAVINRITFPADKDTAFDNGSKIVFPALSDALVNNLELLGNMWGYLKYHHPAIAAGNYNWDYELFRILPGYLNAKSNQERDNILTTWIEKCGTLPTCKNCNPTSTDALLKPDQSWIDKSDLSNDLKLKLKEIYANRNQGENYYIALTPNAGNPVFEHEKGYDKMSHPDEGFRLLCLYKYWNMIEYFYPNKHLTNKKWDTVLKEYIPKFINAKDELAYELAALQLIGELDDSHANLWGGGDRISALRGNNFAPFKGDFVENKFVVTDYYNPEFSDVAKLKIGDVITHINGKSIKVIVDSLRPYYPASNDAAMLRDISIDLLRSSQKTIRLTYISDNQSKEQELPLYEKEKLNMYHFYKVKKDEKCFKLLDGNIGYITLANIREQDIAKLKKSFKDTRGIIIDIRNYPSSYVPFALGSWFVSKPTPFVKITNGNINNPEEFTFVRSHEISNESAPYKGKVVVLVNEISQSQAEYTAMAFRAADNSTIIGSTTAGADGNVSSIVLPGGLRTMISGTGIYYPNGTETQRIGIVPDITVKPTIEGIKKGKDEVLEKAIEIINKQTSLSTTGNKKGTTL